jgi:simple sugar transport system permease protein
MSARLQSAIVPVTAVVLALLLGAVLVLLQGSNPWDAYRALLDGALGSRVAVGRTLEKGTPLVLTGLAVLVALKAGLFNIGAQGQLLLGAIMSAYVGYRITGLPKVVHLPLALLVGALAGSLPGLVSGVLKAYRGAHEVITTIMLNAIVVNLTEWLAGGPWQQKRQAITRTPEIAHSARIPRIADLPVGFAIAVAAAFAVWFLLDRTTLGYRMQAVGANRDAAHYAGISVAGMTVAAMGISGLLAGLGGAIETQGVVYRYEPGFNVGLGFDGITVALLARVSPRLVVPSALLIAIMRAGATKMQADAGVEQELVDVILAVILLLVAAPVVIRWLLRRRDAEGVDIQLTTGWGS